MVSLYRTLVYKAWIKRKMKSLEPVRYRDRRHYIYRILRGLPGMDYENNSLNHFNINNLAWEMIYGVGKVS